jgi:ABC-type glycerol-3-phosphate transport system substrate-binding protein
MTKIKKISARLFTCLLALILSASGLLGSTGLLTASAKVESVGGSKSLVRTSLTEIKNLLTDVTYGDYLSKYPSIKDATTEVKIPLADYIVKEKSEEDDKKNTSKDDEISFETTARVNVEKGFAGADGDVILVGDNGNISWKINIDEEAFYNIEIEYYTGDIKVTDSDDKVIAEGKSSSIERMILIDNKVPFKEARSIVLPRKWVDEYTIKDSDGNEKKILSNSQEFIDFVLKYENNQQDSERLFLKDTSGNEIKPNKQLISEWNTYVLFDSSGYYNDPLKFYFSKGEHVFTLQTVKEPLAIKSITLKKIKSAPDYENYLKAHSDAKDYTGNDKAMIQAEYPTVVSERTIYQLNDRTSTITIPQDPALVKTNEIGGDKWQYVGQWIEYKVSVPEDGFYHIIPRSKQDILSGIYVSRKIYINGELPFKEASYLRFSFTDNWQTRPLNDGKTDFKFYFKKGVNTIRFEVALGEMSEILSTVSSSILEINKYYRKILMITGPTPDTARDYKFERLIPDVVKGLKGQSKVLMDVSQRLVEITGEKGEHAAVLDKVAVYLNRMGTYPTTIAGSMSTLKDYLGNLGTWLTDTQNQPLYFDYICIQSVNAELPEDEPGFFKYLWGELQKFYMSFVSDYNSIGSTIDEMVSSEELKKTEIEVWTTSSREQAQIIRSLVDDNFTAKYNIPVKVKLVVAGTLLPATLAGTGPDVSMGNVQSESVNYAIRSAIKSLNTKTGDTKIGYNFNDLSQWADHPVYGKIIDKIDTFDEAVKRFAPTAMVPLTLYGESYALPENMSFPMLFYRKDIFSELGIKVPNTWDDFYDIIYTLQSKQLDLGFPTGTNGSYIWMYQQGEELYDMGNYDYYMDILHENGYSDEQLKEMGYTYVDENGKTLPKTDGMTINLDSDIAVSTFKSVCELFTTYSFPVSYDFANRFRQGIMPIAVQDYTAYNQLIVFAPEIKGLWEFTPLPGTLQKDGTIDNTTIGSVSAINMMRSVTDDNALAAWTFIQWWTSAEVQSAYGNEMIALLGPSAKQNTANLDALANMSWSKDEYDNLLAQFNAVKCFPEFPGSYIISRYTQFAFLDVSNKGAEPIEELRSYIRDINSELSRKRAEFNLPVAEFFKQLENKK